MVTMKDSRVVAIAEVESQRRISDILMDGMRLLDSRMSCWELVVLTVALYEWDWPCLSRARSVARRRCAQHKLVWDGAVPYSKI